MEPMSGSWTMTRLWGSVHVVSCDEQANSRHTGRRADAHGVHRAGDGAHDVVERKPDCTSPPGLLINSVTGACGSHFCR